MKSKGQKDGLCRVVEDESAPDDLDGGVEVERGERCWARAVKRKTDIERRDALVLSPGEVGEFLTKLGMAIGKHVGDPAVVARIGAELKSLLTPGRDGRALATR